MGASFCRFYPCFTCRNYDGKLKSFLSIIVFCLFLHPLSVMKKLLSERRIIENIRSSLSLPHNDELVKGIGDDCAVYRKRDNILELITTDVLVESVHFDTAWHPPFLLGRKAGAVNLSDIAAMGGRPKYALLSLGLPRDTANDWLEEFLAGFSEVLADFEVVLIGGDTVQSRELMFSVTILGEVEEDKVLFRSGALINDLIWVSGFLGEAAAGLALFQHKVDVSDDNSWNSLCQAHLDPLPQVKLAKTLAATGMVHAMQDLSDGLATDLAHLCKESKVGALVLPDALPVSDSLRQASLHLESDPLDWVLSGGEDFQLLFTSAPDVEKELPQLVKKETGLNVHLVGRVVEGSGVKLLLADGKKEDISYRGYEHFL